jgi:hypothetical protein
MKIDWNKIFAAVFGVMLTIIIGITGALYQMSIKNSERISAIIEKHEERLSDIEKDVAIIYERMSFISQDSKKKSVNCNFKQYLCVNSFSDKKKKRDSEESQS